MENVERGGKPFSCVVARSDDGRVVAESPYLVEQTNDPTAHAEIVAIRQACQRLGSPGLEGHEVYVLAHPCPMCLGALYYASPDRVVFVVTREEEGRHYRDDQRYFEFENFYAEYLKPWHERACRWSTIPRRALRSTGAGRSSTRRSPLAHRAVSCPHGFSIRAPNSGQRAAAHK